MVTKRKILALGLFGSCITAAVSGYLRHTGHAEIGEMVALYGYPPFGLAVLTAAALHFLPSPEAIMPRGKKQPRTR